MPLDARKTFPGTLDQLEQILQWIRDSLLAAGFDTAVAYKMEVASEEALVNIMQHAYRAKTGAIEISMRGDEDFATVQIRDYGPPFNPLKHKIPVNPTATLEARPIGGLGIFFMRKYTDEIHYRREGDANVLTLVKKKEKNNKIAL